MFSRETPDAKVWSFCKFAPNQADFVNDELELEFSTHAETRLKTTPSVRAYCKEAFYGITFFEGWVRSLSIAPNDPGTINGG